MPHVKLALAELALEDRIRLNSLLEQLSADEVSFAVNDPESLGILAEARLIGLTRSDELARYLPDAAVRGLGALAGDALVARLPDP